MMINLEEAQSQLRRLEKHLADKRERGEAASADDERELFKLKIRYSTALQTAHVEAQRRIIQSPQDAPVTTLHPGAQPDPYLSQLRGLSPEPGDRWRTDGLFADRDPEFMGRACRGK